MVPLIQPAAYFDPAIFQAERERIFAPSWHMVGFLRDLAESGQFITADLNGHSIVVQNFEGELRAFRNCCSHRYCRIHDEAKGTGPLRCPYHGWTYNRDGEPVGIPARPRFEGLTPERIHSLALPSCRLAVCGELVFAQESDGPGLQEFLGVAAPTVAAVAAALGPMISSQRLRIRANWKILVENTLESYHVALVHRSTFHKLGLHYHSQDAQGPHTWWRACFNEQTQKSFARSSHLFEHRPLCEQGYFHQFVFPALTIATSFGATFSLQTFLPLDAEHTDFTTLLFQTKLPDSAAPTSAALQWINESAALFNQQVFAEDARICELVQQGVRDAAPGQGVLSDEELRVFAFHESYRDRMISRRSAVTSGA